MSKFPRIRPDELKPGDVFMTNGALWVSWQTPYLEYAEYDREGPIAKSKFWECPVSGVKIIQTAPGGKEAQHKRVVMTHEGPLMGVHYNSKVTRRDDLRDRLYMQPWDRESMKAARAAAEVTT